MSSGFSLAEQAQQVTLLPPAADAAGRTSASGVSLKGAHKAIVTFILNQGNAATIQCSVQQCTNVAKAGAKAIPSVPIYANADEASSVMTRQADGASFTTDAALKTKRVQFEIDPSKLDVAGGFDCICLVTGASNAANITAAEVHIIPSRSGGSVNAMVD